MVRVNYPPGGATNVLAGTTREIQTVRILKPPGGESSISFSDDSSSRTDYRSRTVQAKSPTLTEKEKNFDSKPVETHAEDSVIDGTKASSKQSDSNGKDLQDQASVNSDPAPVVDKKLDEPSNSTEEAMTPPEHVESERLETATGDKSSVSDYVEETVAISESQANSECKVETSASLSVEKSSEITSTSTEIHQSSEEISTSTHENSVHETNDGVKAENDSSASDKSVYDEKNESHTANGSCNGVKNANLPPLVMQSNQSPSSNEPLSSSASPSSPSKQNVGTRDRVFGQPTENITPQPVQQRKIKDHMRSNIFMSDEDYMPTRTSRMNATVSDPKPDVPAAGQRQRIPPGGFSTKLW